MSVERLRMSATVKEPSLPRFPTLFLDGSSGAISKDDTWTPGSKCVPNCPKPERERREGAKNEAVEKLQEDAKRRLEGQPMSKRPHVKKKKTKGQLAPSLRCIRWRSACLSAVSRTSREKFCKQKVFFFLSLTQKLNVHCYPCRCTVRLSPLILRTKCGNPDHLCGSIWTRVLRRRWRRGRRLPRSLNRKLTRLKR